MKKISAIITLLFIFALSGMYGTPVKDTYATVPEDTTGCDGLGAVLTNTSETADEYIHVYKSYYDLAKYGKIRRITDGLGRYISIEYASAVMPSVYTPSADSSYPVNCYTLPVAVVSATGMSAGFDGNTTITTTGYDTAKGVITDETVRTDGGSMYKKVSYPGGLDVTYLYDAKGFRTGVIAGNDTVCKVEEYDGLNYITSFKGKLRNRQTRDARGFISDISLTHGNDVIETLSLDYDGGTGNLLSRKRNDEDEETFEYDSLDRLVSVSRDGEEVMAVEYSADGNITYKTGVGCYEYDTTGKPHAVVEVDNTDGSISEMTQDIKYNDFGKIARISLSSLCTTNLKDLVQLDSMRVWDGVLEPVNRTATAFGNSVPAVKIDDPEYTDFIYGPDRDRWYSETSIGNVTLRSTVYAGDYEKITERGVTREFYYLDGNTVIVKQDGEFRSYQAFTDNIGSVLAIVDEDGNSVFEASYDAWGRQTVTLNDIGFRRGYTGHEMMNVDGLVNMNGRLYDPALGRFLSPDNYVQMPDNSQNFNRYTYCLNNPLKYNDPSGEIFGIDDLLFFSVASGAMMGFMNAKMSGTSPLKGAITGGLSGLASYGIGSAFGHQLGSLGHELLRAGAHGLSNGVLNALNGDNFGVGFATGCFSSLVGSGAQALHFNSAGIMASTAATGGIASWALGGDWYRGAMTGLNIGALNHGWTTMNGERVYELDEVVVIGRRINILPSYCIGTIAKYNDYCGSAISGFKTDSYRYAMISSAINSSVSGNESNLRYIEKISSYNGNISNLAKYNKGITKFVGVYNTYSGFVQDEYSIGYNTVKAGCNYASGYYGGIAGAKIGAKVGAGIGSCFEGIGAIPGAIIGGIIGGLGGSYLFQATSDATIDFLYK